MATSKQYAWYLEGNQIAIVEKDVSFDNNVDSKDYGPGASRARWESPQATITDGLEIEYSYVPMWNTLSNPTVDYNKFYVNGWTVVDGYLSFLRSSNSSAIMNWTSANESNVTAGSQGGSKDYILVEGSDRWNGTHEVQTAGNGGILKTYTKVHERFPQFTGTTNIDFNTSEQIFGGSSSGTYLSQFFSAGDYMFITGSGTSANNGLFSVSSSTITLSEETSFVTVGTKYTVVHQTTGTTAIAETGIDNEYSADADFTAESDQTDIAVYKCERDFCSLTTDILPLQDESFDIPLKSYLNNALVYYVRAKLAEDAGELKLREYAMREFRKMIEKHENSRISGLRITSPGSHAIR